MFNPIQLIVDQTISAVREHLNKAEKSQDHMVQRCEHYLEAARQAINGLFAAYDEILVKAETCNLDDPKQVEELKVSIKQYANVDHIRPELRQAIKGISNCHDDLKLIAERPLQLPKNKEQRQQTVAKVRKLLRNLTTQLSRLESEGLQHLKAGTGIGIRSLDRIMGFVQGYQFNLSGNRSERLADLVSHIRDERSKDELWALTDSMIDTISELNRGFR